MTDRVIDTSNLDNFKEALEKFQPPKQGRLKIPYVLYGAWEINHSADAGNVPTLNYVLKTLICRVNPPSVSKIIYYKNKGWQVLDYWFPTKNDLPAKTGDTEHGWIGNLRHAADDPYAEVRSQCAALKLGAANRDESRKEISKLKEELEAERAKNGDNKSTRTGSRRVARKSESEEQGQAVSVRSETENEGAEG